MAAILIVEDRPLSRKFLATLLTSAGHAVQEAGDGVEALELAGAARPDLVISDILMPKVDGYELVRRLHATEALASIPVIFYTAAYHEREARTLATQCGVVDVLTKPTDAKTILAKVDAALRSKGTPAAATPDQLQVERDHLNVVSFALASRTHEFEASEHRMAAIVEVAREIAAERNPGEIMTRVCEAAREVTLAQHASIGMVVEGDTALRRLATSGAGEDRGSDDALDEELVEPVLREGRCVRIPTGARGPDTVSLLVVPIATAHRVYGCLNLRRKLGADEFTDVDEQVAHALGTHAGIAYENARLYEEFQRHAEQLEQEIQVRIQAEHALRETEARTEFALRAAAMCVWDLDLETSSLSWSENLPAVFGLPVDQAPRTCEAFLGVIHPADREDVRARLDQAVEDDAEVAAEFRAIRPDHQIRWIAWRARVVKDGTGRATRAIGMATDIDSQKLLEEQFRQAQRMEAVGQLAGGVAHDFNNLLMAIRGYADLLAPTFDTGDHRRADLEEIVRAADRAAGLTRQLLAFSRQQVLQPTRFDLNKLVTEATSMLRRLTGEQIDLLTALDPGGAHIYADEGQIEQVLMNLVVNARDAMPHGGRLFIETSTLQLGETTLGRESNVRPGSYVLLSVTDTGTGMDEATRQRIFEPFFTTKERGHGTGLGLPMVYGSIKQSGGFVTVYSEPRQGTTFNIYLPRVESAALRELPKPQARRGGSETVLLVEDEASVRSLSRKILERVGYRVLEAENPLEAVDVFCRADRPVHILVTDVIMPGSNGPSLFAKLSTLQPDLKVLYMSGYTGEALTHTVGLPARSAFLQKPFPREALIAKVREVLDR
jgi:PAS domain S-box-containing protein